MDGKPWREGDELVFGLESWGPGGVEERWLVTLTDRGHDEVGVAADGTRLPVMRAVGYVSAPNDDSQNEHHRGSVFSLRRRVSARITALDGSHLGEASGATFEKVHELGMHRYLGLDPEEKRRRSVPKGGDGSAARPFEHGTDDPWWRVVVQFQLHRAFRENAALAGLLERLAGSPGLLDLPSILFRPVLEIHMAGDEDTAPVPAPDVLPWTAPCAFAVPSHFSIGSLRALEVVLFVLPPEGPLPLSAGVFAIRGRQPESPARGFALVLLGCRRGEPAAK